MKNNQEQETPDQVIRFYGKIDYALESTALKQITFIHLSKLNDPFDPALDNLTDFHNKYESLLAYVQKHQPTQLSFFKEKFPKHNWKATVDSWTNLATKIRENMFVFSTCKILAENHPRDNLYMWGHYGNGHRGVAIEFNASALAKSIKEGNSDNTSKWLKMTYLKKIPKINCEDITEYVMNAEQNADDLLAYGQKLYSKIWQRLRSKAEVWNSENEWRLVLDNNETTLKILRHNIPSNAVTAIYLGCRITEQQQNDFIHESKLNFPSASVFRAKMREGEYALDFEKIV